MSGSRRRPEPRETVDPAELVEAERLMTLANDCAVAGIQRRCLILRLSSLPADCAKPHHLRLAREAIDPLRTADRAQVFGLPNRDIAVVWRGQATAALAAARRAIGLLFADSVPDALAPDALCMVFELPQDAAPLVALIESGVAAATPAADGIAAGAAPLDAAALARLEATLARADVARFARRAQVMAVSPTGGFQPVWEMRTLSVDELAAELAPDRAPRRDPWLFARLTRTLDRRMLALLADPAELRGAGPFGLDLNVGSLLAPEFLRFDAALPQGLRGQVWIGLLPADILADPGAFIFARDFAHARGYRLVLRLPAADLLPVVPLDRMGLDLLQLRWSPDLPGQQPGRFAATAERMLLTHADGAEAIAWGRANGVRLFHGRATAAGRTASGMALAAP